MGVLSWLFGGKQNQHSGRDAIPSPEIDWRSSERHLKLLGYFLYPSNPTQGVPSYWDDILRLPRLTVVSQLREMGLLVIPKTADALGYALTLADLKTLAKERSLPVSGKKDQLVERLLSNDPGGMQKKVAELDLLECSPEAREAAIQFKETCKQEKAEAEALCLTHLQNFSFQEASQVVSNYEARQIIGRGIGIDWSSSSTATSMTTDLASIFSSRPGILAELSNRDLQAARIVAGMMHLWGITRAKEYFPAEFVGIARMDPDTVARMLIFYAHQQRDLRQFKDAKIKSATIVTTMDSHTCDECKTLAGRTYSIGKLPELPYPSCSCSLGCRCYAQANF